MVYVTLTQITFDSASIRLFCPFENPNLPIFLDRSVI
jgi:hypothetical protein